MKHIDTNTEDRSTWRRGEQPRVLIGPPRQEMPKMPLALGPAGRPRRPTRFAGEGAVVQEPRARAWAEGQGAWPNGRNERDQAGGESLLSFRFCALAKLECVVLDRELIDRPALLAVKMMNSGNQMLRNGRARCGVAPKWVVRFPRPCPLAAKGRLRGGLWGARSTATRSMYLLR